MLQAASHKVQCPELLSELSERPTVGACQEESSGSGIGVEKGNMEDVEMVSS